MLGSPSRKNVAVCKMQNNNADQGGEKKKQPENRLVIVGKQTVVGIPGVQIETHTQVVSNRGKQGTGSGKANPDSSKLKLTKPDGKSTSPVIQGKPLIDVSALPHLQIETPSVNRTSRITLASPLQVPLPAPDDVLSISTGSTTSSQSLARRSSIGWERRVSINTPARRNSEKEVTWLEADESDDVTSNVDDLLDPSCDRPSIVVSMEGRHGRNISFVLDHADSDVKEYLNRRDSCDTTNRPSSNLD